MSFYLLSDMLTHKSRDNSSDSSSSRKQISPNSSSQRTKNAIKFQAQDATVIWQDSENQEQHVDHVSLDVNYDGEQNTAFFNLHTKIRIKTLKRALYLRIPPEIIISITYKNEENIRSLDFLLTQKPEFIIPPEPLNSRKSTKDSLEKFMALSSMTKFTVRLREHEPTRPDDHCVVKSKDLQKIASLFMPRPTTDRKRAGIRGLYAGKPGRIFDASATATSGGVKAATPPPYRIPKSGQNLRKRKRGESQVDDDGLSESRDVTPLEKRLEKLECSLSTVVEMVGSLIQLTQDDEHRRFGSEEKEDLIKEVIGEVDAALEDRMEDLWFQYCDKVKDAEDDLDRTLTQNREDVDEENKKHLQRLDDAISEHLDEVKANTREMIAESVNEHIKGTKWRLEGPVSLHF
ncbi:hypothetical protein V8C35DRAFT_303378 [Trichoderma chlorosporum]